MAKQSHATTDLADRLKEYRDIESPVDREIAELMGRKEASAYGVEKAYDRAFKQGNYSSIEALKREISRAEEEEDFLMIAIMTVH